jgi:hypothetical protein
MPGENGAACAAEIWHSAAAAASANSPSDPEGGMNEDRFNMDIRKFLKVVGVTSQREIEQAVRAALARGTLPDKSVLKASVTLSVPEIGLTHVIEGEIGLD